MWYLRELEAAYGKPLDKDVLLFPKIDGQGRWHFDVPMCTRGLLRDFRGLARAAGLPAAIVEVLTLHGARAGGATDAFIEMGGTPLAVAHIKKQGRWKSDCWGIYVRLRRAYVSTVFENILKTAGLTRSEREMVEAQRDAAVDAAAAMAA